MTIDQVSGTGAASTFIRPSSASPRWRFDFTGEGGELFGITFMNLLLSIATLGIWFAWGRVRELAFTARNVVCDGDPMSFHGRGAELFRGVLIAFFAFLLPIYGVFLAAGFTRGVTATLLVALGYVLVFVLVAFASVGSLRYRLPRTEWRGIRFGFDGSSREFLRGFLPRVLLLIATLGIAYPHVACWRRRWMLEHCRFGTARFACDAEPGPLYGTWIPMWFLIPFTLGWTLVYYHGVQQAHLWEHSRLDQARFRTDMTGGGWTGLHFTNTLLALVTLGIATPWVMVRLERYFFENLALESTLDLAVIQQQAQSTGSLGEGLLDSLQVDAGLHLG